jgi:hypothetical protein
MGHGEVERRQVLALEEVVQVRRGENEAAAADLHRPGISRR